MKFKKATSFILSFIMAVSSLNMCFAKTQADNSSEPETVDAVASEAAADYGINLAAVADNIAYAVKGGNIYFDPSTGEIVSADNGIIEANIPSSINGIPVTEISYDAFLKCSETLTSVTIPDGVTEIYSDTFKYCTSLTTVIIPDSVTSIDSKAFYDCKSLTSVIIPNSVTYIGSGAFEGCTLMTNVTIGNGVTTIDWWAFEDCTSLTSITIPDSVTLIGLDAFSGCTSLTNVTIPDNVTSIGGGAFSGCTSLTSINVSENNTAYSSINGVLYNKDKTELVKIPEGKGIKEFNIPNSVTSIGQHAFDYCTLLTNVTIPDSVTSISVQAFYGCTSLTNVTIPDSVTSIDNSAFYGCTSLTSINVSENNTEYSSIDGVLYNKDKTKLIKMSEGSEIREFNIPDNVTSIGDSAFEGCTLLTSINIPNGVTDIEYDTFDGCRSLTSITIPDSVTSIYDYSFYGCDKNKLIFHVNQGSYADTWALEHGFKVSYITPPAEDMKGDVNGDGSVTSFDASQVLLHASKVKELSADIIKSLDINNDGVITSYDASQILLKASGLKNI